MKHTRNIILGLLATLALATPALAQTPAEKPVCAHCTLVWTSSPTRIEAVVKLSSGEKATRQYASLDCLRSGMESAGSSLLKLSIIDHNTYGTEKETMLDGQKAWFAYGTRRTLAGSRKPYIAAFATESDARSAALVLGGDVVNYAAMDKRLTEERAAETGAVKATSAPGATGADPYVCPCAGGCCDHISSDQPGECPDCGMKLIRKSEKDKQ